LYAICIFEEAARVYAHNDHDKHQNSWSYTKTNEVSQGVELLAKQAVGLRETRYEAIEEIEQGSNSQSVNSPIEPPTQTKNNGADATEQVKGGDEISQTKHERVFCKSTD
jgi:hypothetical protein